MLLIAQSLISTIQNLLKAPKQQLTLMGAGQAVHSEEATGCYAD